MNEVKIKEIVSVIEQLSAKNLYRVLIFAKGLLNAEESKNL
jgi:hypothetical protein